MRVVLSLLLATLSLGSTPLDCLRFTEADADQKVLQDLRLALEGEWSGVLEYRDYSEPPASTKRVKLPTWLSISKEAGSLRFRYIYDDGPAKTVFETNLVTINTTSSTWSTTPDNASGAKTPNEKLEVATIGGLPQLKSGRGTLVLTGTGIDNGVSAEVRTTLRSGRNILEILRETRRPGEEFQFRHSYTFVRALPPTSKSLPPV